MPIITIESGKLEQDIKTELIRQLTETAVKVTGIRPGAFTILIHENEHDNIGIGGQLFSEYLAGKD